MITRTHATMTAIALVVAGIVVAAGASFGVFRIGQRESRVGHFPAVAPVASTPARSEIITAGGSTTTRPLTGRSDHDADADD